MFSIFLDSDNNPEGYQDKVALKLISAAASWGLIAFYLFFLVLEIR
jgi:hypothetical protein